MRELCSEAGGKPSRIRPGGERVVSMRKIVAGLLPVLLMGSGEADAQSITPISRAPAASSPSFVTLGKAEAVEAHALRRGSGEDADVFALSTSVIAYGSGAIAPARDEKVAAIPEPVAAAAPEPAAPAKPVWRAESMPLVIRGGVVGDAFSAPPAPTVTLQEEQARPSAAAPASEPAPPPAAATRSPL